MSKTNSSMVKFQKALLSVFSLFCIALSGNVSAQTVSNSGWSVSQETSLEESNQDPIVLAHKIHNYQQRIIAFAETTNQLNELASLKSNFLKKQQALAANFPTAPLEASFEQINAWLRQHPEEAEYYQTILDSILQNLNQ
ncbi:MAG: hypothetical protein FJ349_09345 [Sphingomonadales bacterium]|nr:hypothetical protein [Sphingomonadales bacterium]